MVKVVYIFEPRRDAAVVWQQTDSITHPWVVVGKVKVFSQGGYLIIPISKIKESLKEEVKNG